MKKNETLDQIFQLVADARLGEAMDALENYLLGQVGQGSAVRQQDLEQMNALRDDYRLMAEYWQRGYDDPQREAVAQRLLRRVWVLTANVYGRWMLLGSPFMKVLHQRPRTQHADWSIASVRNDMESFVTNLALLDLEPEHTRQQKTVDLYKEHAEQMRNLFDYILTSRQWSEGLADAFIGIVLSPTLASIDQQLIVSAVMLSAMQLFCPQKFRVLCEVYRQATDEQLRQRALIGWALTADGQASKVFPEVAQRIGDLCADERTQQELAEMQMQLFYCLQADQDRDTIQNEIIPDIMSGSKLKVTGRGLEEVEDEQLDDILHPEAEELAMERMEQSVQRMAEMQRQGADIYFGGFSQMKRFPFFNDVTNWFVPFYPQHPAISQTWNGTRASRLLKTITRLGAFCDSDKYSFVLAFNMVLDRLPKNVLKMVEEGEAMALPVGGEVSIVDQQQPAFVRRVCLQNLYRFFRLFSARGEFNNPFVEERRVLFFCNELFRQPSLSQQAMAVGRFLMKRRQWTEAMKVLSNIAPEKRGVPLYIMLGTAMQHLSSTSSPSPAECFRQALQMEPDNERAQAGLARALFASHDYEEALAVYEKLLALKPDHSSYQQGAAVCMLHVGREEEALQLLYKLSFLHADDVGVSRILAWALTLTGKFDQANKIYDQLLGVESPNPQDILNQAYCHWLAHRIGQAIPLFRRFVELQGDADFSLEQEFMQTEHQHLAQRGITDTEIRLMLDAVRA
ncbi:MAG: tetratricopeptide repeat protein [Prevotella sp.]|nr:tetratricopeptide repeat protein [Prevotella sp.]